MCSLFHIEAKDDQKDSLAAHIKCFFQVKTAKMYFGSNVMLHLEENTGKLVLLPGILRPGQNEENFNYLLKPK